MPLTYLLTIITVIFSIQGCYKQKVENVISADLTGEWIPAKATGASLAADTRSALLLIAPNGSFRATGFTGAFFEGATPDISGVWRFDGKNSDNQLKLTWRKGEFDVMESFKVTKTGDVLEIVMWVNDQSMDKVLIMRKK
jgi:hypothetical protein